MCACFFLWSYKSFQIVYEYTLHLVFDLSLKFQIAFQIASECAILPSMVSTCSGGADSHPHAPPTQNPGTPLQHCSIKHFGYTDESWSIVNYNCIEYREVIQCILSCVRLQSYNSCICKTSIYLYHLLINLPFSTSLVSAVLSRR